MRYFFIFLSFHFCNIGNAQNLTGVWKSVSEIKLHGMMVRDFEMQIIQTDSLYEALISYSYDYNHKKRGNVEMLSKIIAVSSTRASHNTLYCGCTSNPGIINSDFPYSPGAMKITEIRHLSCPLITFKEEENSPGDCHYLNYILKWSKKEKTEWLSGLGVTYGTFSGGNLELQKVRNLTPNETLFIRENVLKKVPALVSKPFIESKITTPLFELNDKSIIPENIKTRENEIVKIITLEPIQRKNKGNKIQTNLKQNSQKIEINVYDYGKIDHDIISVYVDKKLILSNGELTKKPLKLILEMDETLNKYHEVILVAENLGDVPPNTAFMKIKAGDKTYEVKISSDLQKNAVIVFKYKK
jgi:hypothetical protein